jgi:hypothetical protein
MNTFEKVTKFLVALTLALVLSVALTQEGEEAAYVVVVYETIVDVISYPAEFFEIIRPFWPGINVDLPIPNPGGGGGGGQVPEPNCDGLLLNLFDALYKAGLAGRIAESLFEQNSGEPALFYSDGNPANKKAVGIVFAGVSAGGKGDIANIRSQMEALNCFKP